MFTRCAAVPCPPSHAPPAAKKVRRVFMVRSLRWIGQGAGQSPPGVSVGQQLRAELNLHIRMLATDRVGVTAVLQQDLRLLHAP